ncbi:YlaH-like family protein [Paenibacillus senegalensis]|uniref:YlaH-like family protein n=1 Tax=Paenibacillus senegalensis TaxID=1465766 RepID=UPI000288A2F3|nr:YlaH-like family protein [Paenibacillus senegalensis]
MSALYDWFFAHPWITFFIIFAGLAFVYNKVFRVKKLPILKEIIVYIIMAIGAFILLLFQLDLRIPIVPSLAIAVLLMLTVKIRYWIEGRQEKDNKQE